MRLLTILFLSVTICSTAQDTNYKAESSRSTLKWFGYSLFSFGEHHGLINLGNGNLVVRNNNIIGGAFEIDMTTITNTDMEEADGGKSLSDHLKSDDFFSVDKFPKASFTITKVEPIKDSEAGSPNVEIFGNLTLKGITQPLNFRSILSSTENEMIATGKFKFDRTKWNVRYGSGKFFDSVGDNAISDAIGIEFSIKFTKQ